MSRAMAGEADLGQPMSARSDGPSSMQQKMMRQRELVLRRQTEAAKSFGVVAQQHPPPSRAVSETPQVLSARGPPRVGIAPAADMQAPPEVQPPAPEVVSEHLQAMQGLEYGSLEEELLASGKAIELDEAEECTDRGPDPMGQGWDLDVRKGAGDGKQPRGKRSFWRPWKAEQGEMVENCPVDEVSRVELDASGADSPELGRDRKRVGFGEIPDGTAVAGATSALNMGRVATPWTGSSKADLDPLLPGELHPDTGSSVEPLLDIMEESMA